jgi:aldehyde dehydrogenase (NAD+)
VVFEGDAGVTSTLLNQPFDKFFFTGSPRVGKIVMKAAAEHLASVTLELGGKSPCIVTADANLSMAAKRIVWGKFLNAGQTCIAPDYVIVEKRVEQQLLTLIKQQILKVFGDDASASEAYVRIINQRQFDRICGLIDPSKVFTGGKADAQKLYIEPTVMRDVKLSDAVMQEEIFGPVLPVLSVENRDEVFDLIRNHRNPLALYLFTSSRKYRKQILQRVPFGGGAVNDTVMHFVNSNLPFGGVGYSGMGSYHGKYGFDCFSREKGVVYKATWFEPFMKYPPYNSFKKWLLKFVVE